MTTPGRRIGIPGRNRTNDQIEHPYGYEPAILPATPPSWLVNSQISKKLQRFACAVATCRNYRILHFVRRRETHAIHPM
jgi:hypothetical protein